MIVAQSAPIQERSVATSDWHQLGVALGVLVVRAGVLLLVPQSG